MLNSIIRSILTSLTALVLVSACGQRAIMTEPLVTRHTSRDLEEVRDHSMSLARQYGKKHILVGFDLDNTLLAGNTDLGADQWYDWQREMQKAEACDPRLVADRLAAQGALYHIGSMRPTQNNAAAIVSEIQSAGISTLLITARGQDFRLPTFRELRRNGFNFRDHSPGPLGGFQESYLPLQDSRKVRYEDGVYMLAGQHKGDMLMLLFKRLGLALPEVVIFVDDNSKNTNAMAEALEAANIRGEIYDYQREAQRVARFDANGASADWSRVRPALAVIEEVMGPVNFDLPETGKPADDCQ
jgi:hypothetical protein